MTSVLSCAFSCIDETLDLSYYMSLLTCLVTKTLTYFIHE